MLLVQLDVTYAHQLSVNNCLHPYLDESSLSGQPLSIIALHFSIFGERETKRKQFLEGTLFVTGSFSFRLLEVVVTISSLKILRCELKIVFFLVPPPIEK